jgi:STAS-like domain of unknown function (DUF4325)
MRPLTLNVNMHLPDRILVTRESAQQLSAPLHTLVREALASGSAGGPATVTLDFRGIAGLSPSFVDELIRVFEAAVGGAHADEPCALVISNPPARLSSKFEAIARGHDLTVRIQSDGSWRIEGTDGASRGSNATEQFDATRRRVDDA